MKRIRIIGKDLDKINCLRGKFLEKGFECVEENPDLVISYGGDGMFLISERMFPGVPKILVRDSEIGNKYEDYCIDEILDFYSSGNFDLEEIQKIRATKKGQFEVRELVGVNDIVIRNSLPTEAIRFRYRINEGVWSETLIGDGVVISTPYGSSEGAYFHSITEESFNEGIGMAFNNTTKKLSPKIQKIGDEIEVEIIRGLGVLVSDNNRDFVNLEKGDTIKIKIVEEVARIVRFKEYHGKDKS